MSQYHYNISKDVKSTNIQITGSSNATPADTSSRYYSEFNHSTNLKQSADKYTQKNEYEEPRLDTSKPAMVPVGTSLNDLGNYYLGNNSFLQACYLAYSQHHNLVIRPDDIWIAIMTQFSFYLNAHAEQLRSKIVSHDDKKDLEVVANATLFSAPYDEMTLTMTELIAKNINDPTLKDWAMPSFTTTTYTDRIVGAVCLMATMKKYFNFKYSLRCGLPSVTLLGSVEDWKSIKDKVQRLNEFDLQEKLMSKWTTMLNPIIDQFIASVEGKADTEWWNRIANHVGGGSGPTWLSGWITVFSCFAEDGEWRGDDKEKHGFRTKGELVSEWPLIDTEEIAHGYVVLDVKIDDNGTMYDAQLFGGHYTVKLADEKSTIVPQLNWCMMVKESDLPALKKN